MNDTRLDTPGEHRRGIARGVTNAILSATSPRGVLLTGSVARGDSDDLSDIDMIAYYDELPDEDALRQVWRDLGRPDRLSSPGRTTTSASTFFRIDGIECQVAHLLASSVERDLDSVLDELSVDPMLHKKIIGIVGGVPLFGDALIREWQRRLANFPAPLARTMIEHYLNRIVPIWTYRDALARRDAAIWTQEVLVSSAYGILGTVAGLNRHYFSSFQFKRAGRFIEAQPVAPKNLAARLDGLFSADIDQSIGDLERLTVELLMLVQRTMPEAIVPDQLRRTVERTVHSAGEV